MIVLRRSTGKKFIETIEAALSDAGYAGNNVTGDGVEIAAGASQAVTGDGGGASGVFKSLTPSTDLVNDLTPQLGGNLDVNGQSIVSVSAGNINITPDTTGRVVIDGLSYPAADGTADQVVVTDGAGNLSFASASASLGNSLSLSGGSGWTISVDGNNNLVFSYGGSTVAKVATNGAITSEDDITAFGTV